MHPQLLSPRLTPLIDGSAKTHPDTLRAVSIAIYEARLTLAGQRDQKFLVDLIHRIVGAVVSATDFDFDMKALQFRYLGLNSHRRATELIKYCFSFGDQSLLLCGRVTELVKPIPQANVMDWFLGWFQPFIGSVRIYLESQGRDLSVDPFRSCLSATVELVIESGVGKKPVERFPKDWLTSFGCQCPVCGEVRAFLLGGNSQWTYKANQTARSHVEDHIRAARRLKLSCDILRDGSPHTLRVCYSM